MNQAGNLHRDDRYRTGSPRFPAGFSRYNTLICWIFALLPLGVVGAAFILPYGAALFGGFRGGAAGLPFTGNAMILPVAFFTARQAALSTLVALVLGLPGAWFFGSGGHRSALLRALTGVPFALPAILVVLGFILFFGNAGWVNRFFMALSGADEGPLRILYKPSAIILAHGFYNFPLVIRLVGDSFAQSKRAYAPAAASLGASDLLTAITVLLPMAIPSVMAAALMVFLYSFTSFSIVLVLGGGPAASTLAVEIYRYARISLDYNAAGKLALVETAIGVTAFLGYLSFERWSRAVVPLNMDTGTILENKKSSPVVKGLAIVYGLVVFFLVLGPLLSIPLESFLYKPSRSALPRLSLRWWQSMDILILALGRSLLLACIAASFACFLAVIAAAAAKNAGQGSFLETMLRSTATIPLVSSGIVLSLGWLMVYGREQPRSIWALAVIHGVSALPFAFNSISAGLGDLSSNILNAASVFGAGPVRRILTVELPLSARRLRSAWAFSAAISLGELNGVLMLGMEKWETLPLLIYRAVGAYHYGIACAAGTILVICLIAAFLVSEISFPKRVR